MATCVRGGFRYKRHKIENGKCVKCGGVVVDSKDMESELRHAAEQLVQKIREQGL